MSTPTSPIIILPTGDAVRADTINAVRADAGYLYVRCEGDTRIGGSFATCELAKAARDGVIEQWQAALVPKSSPISEAVEAVLGGGS